MTRFSVTHPAADTSLPPGVRICENSWLARIAAWKLKGHSAALVFGRTIFLYNVNKASFLEDKAWLRHELKHVEQYQRLGKWNFLWQYFLEWVKKGYYQNRFEQEAREAEQCLPATKEKATSGEAAL